MPIAHGAMTPGPVPRTRTPTDYTIPSCTYTYDAHNVPRYDQTNINIALDYPLTSHPRWGILLVLNRYTHTIGATAMLFVLTVWDEANERHTLKFMDYEDAEAMAHEAIANGAEYADVTNSHTGKELLSLFA
jgi:hypothetical protein